MDINQRLGANLQRLCFDQISIAEVCRKTGIHRTQFNRYLYGRNLPNSKTLKKLSAYFRVDELDLFAAPNGVKTPSGQQTQDPDATPFNHILREMRGRQNASLQAGRHLIYYPLQGAPGYYMRALMLVRPDGIGQSFTRLTVFPKQSGFPHFLVKARHHGIVASNGAQTYLVGVTNGPSPQVSLIALQENKSSFDKNFLSGLALIRTTTDFLAAPAVVQSISSTLPIRELLRGLGPVHHNDASVDPMVRMLLTPNAPQLLDRASEFFYSMTSSLAPNTAIALHDRENFSGDRLIGRTL